VRYAVQKAKAKELCSMARPGMATLLRRVRELTHAGSADYTLAGMTYWHDDELQVYLDQHRTEHRAVRLQAVADFQNGTYSYTRYRLPQWARHLEEPAGESSNSWRIYDSMGVTIGTGAYSLNVAAGVVTFNSDQQNAPRYADFCIYDLYRAASAVWEAKAAHAAQYVNWESDNHRIEAAQERAHCMAMAVYLRSQAGPKTGRLVRTDEG
jgi:hypothetical protein